jgi:phage FluMu protein Com
MKYYVVCPVCGYKLLKAADGSNIEIYCPKCKEKLTVEVTDNKIVINRLPIKTDTE